MLAYVTCPHSSGYVNKLSFISLPFQIRESNLLEQKRQIVIFRLISLFVPVEGISRILHIVGDLWSALSKNSMKLKRKEKKKKKDQVILYATQDETS